MRKSVWINDTVLKTLKRKCVSIWYDKITKEGTMYIVTNNNQTTATLSELCNTIKEMKK